MLDKTSFYGYDLEELGASFGDATLEFTSDGVRKLALIEDSKPTNWFKTGLMIFGGCVAILIGVALAMATELLIWCFASLHSKNDGTCHGN